MTDVALPKPKLSEREGFAAKAVRFLTKAPVQIVLLLLGVFWLIPTVGIFFTSILPAQAFSVNGWWQI